MFHSYMSLPEGIVPKHQLKKYISASKWFFPMKTPFPAMFDDTIAAVNKKGRSWNLWDSDGKDLNKVIRASTSLELRWKPPCFQ